MTRIGLFSAIMSILVCSFQPIVTSVHCQDVTQLWVIDQQKELGDELYKTVTSIEEGKKMVIGLTRDRVVGIDFEGNISSKVTFLPGQRGNISADGRYVGVMTMKNAFIRRFELKTIDGRAVASIEPPSGCISFLVGSDANMIVAVSVGKSSVLTGPYSYHFYDSTGQILRHAKAIRSQQAWFSLEGKALVVNDRRNGIKAFAEDGSLSWSVDEPYRVFVVSNKARRVIGNSASEIRKVAIFENGEIKRHVKFENPVRNLVMSPNGRFIVASDARTIRLFVNQLRDAWEYTFTDKSLDINSVSVSGRGFVACGLIRDNGEEKPIETRYTEGLAVLFDRSGEMIWRRSYALNRSNAWIPIVALAPMGENEMALTVQTRESFFLYRIMMHH